MGEITVNGIDGYIDSVILAGAAEGNVLPLTSTCNARCVFCSHRQNPPGVKACRIAPRSLAQVKQALAFMDPAKPVVIGESATRVIEGEPFTHPNITEVLQLVRTTLPRAAIQVTTNGILLDEEVVDLLARLGKVEVCLSLNSASEVGRSLLMGDISPERAIRSAQLLKSCGVPFHGSIVAMPHLVGWSDLEDTVHYLCDCGAATVRVFLPGFTVLAPPALRFEPSLWKELSDFITRVREETGIPITCEPPLIRDLEPRVAGVIAASPADEAGLCAGDVIETVDRMPVRTRVHAFHQVLKAGCPELGVRRGGGQQVFMVKKKRGERSGLVMDYDLLPGLPVDMVRAARRRGAQGALALTSELAGPVLEMGLRQFGGKESKVEAVVVRNNFFGGSIKAAGLLTVADFGAALEDYFREKPGKGIQLVLLPGLAFDRRGRDLTGRSYLELEEKFGITCEVL